LPLWIRVYNDNTTSNNSFQIVYTVFEVIPWWWILVLCAYPVPWFQTGSSSS
jgi:hypothetical protein